MATIRARREPPPFRHATVVAVEPRSDRLVRLTLAGPDLRDLDIGLPAASVRVLVPRPDERVGTAAGAGSGPGAAAVTLPTWDGNEFLFADGRRPPIRTLTPVRLDPEAGALDVEVVLHGAGPLSTWVAGGPLGDPTAVSGTGRGYTIDPSAPAFVLAGDESALPAIGVLVDALAAAAPTIPVRVIVEAVDPTVTVDLPSHAGTDVRWVGLGEHDRPGDALGRAIESLDLEPGTRLWVAGEAAGVHRIRGHLFEERGLPRSQAVVRGYWKVGRGGDDPAD